MTAAETERTNAQYRAAVAPCRALFAQKAQDYGASWGVLRPSSVTDQLLIKAKRIRTLQETGVNKVGDSIESEFVGILNYCVIGLIVLDPALVQQIEASNYQPNAALLLAAYDAQIELAYQTMLLKNHDYGEAWREMRVSSITDMLLVRLLRIRQIEDNAGQTLVSEGVAANYIDMINYAIFALILLHITP